MSCSYCLGVSIIALLYATAQLLRDLHRLSSGRELVAGRKVAAIIDFTGDQVGATHSPRLSCLTTYWLPTYFSLTT